MGSIRKIGRNYQIDACLHGVRVRKIVGPSKKVAREVLAEIEGQLVRGEYGLDRAETPIAEVFRAFDGYARTNMARSSAARYSNVIDRFNEFLDKRSKVSMCSNLSQAVIEDFRQYRLSGPHPPKTKSMNFEIKALRTIFNYAIKWKLMNVNPTDGVKTQRVTDAKPLRFLSDEECAALLGASSFDMRAILLAFLTTGMRRGELEHLGWTDVDFRTDMIHIRHKPDWRPKTGERDIPMNPSLRDVLLEMKSRRSRACKHVFTIEGKPAVDCDIRDRIARIASRAGVNNLTSVHSLRHTFGSKLVRIGVPLPVVQRLLGHSDIGTTMIYVHTTSDEHRAAVSKLHYSDDC